MTEQDRALFRVPESIKLRLEREAEMRHSSLSSLLRQIILEYLHPQSDPERHLS